MCKAHNDLHADQQINCISVVWRFHESGSEVGKNVQKVPFVEREENVEKQFDFPSEPQFPHLWDWGDNSAWFRELLQEPTGISESPW